MGYNKAEWEELINEFSNENLFYKSKLKSVLFFNLFLGFLILFLGFVLMIFTNISILSIVITLMSLPLLFIAYRERLYFKSEIKSNNFMINMMKSIIEEEKL